MEVNSKTDVIADDIPAKNDDDYLDFKSPASSPVPSLCESFSSFGSFDDGFQFAGEYRPSCDELPAFSIQSVSPSGRSISPIIDNEQYSLLNLSISPISSLSDLTANDDDERVNRTNENYDDDDDDSDRVSLAELNAQINTPPSGHNCSKKRLNLETIFEGVFLETPPKKLKFNSWGFGDNITVERINTYVMEQRQKAEMTNDPNRLCDIFENKLDIS